MIFIPIVPPLPFCPGKGHLFFWDLSRTPNQKERDRRLEKPARKRVKRVGEQIYDLRTFFPQHLSKSVQEPKALEASHELSARGLLDGVRFLRRRSPFGLIRGSISHVSALIPTTSVSELPSLPSLPSPVPLSVYFVDFRGFGVGAGWTLKADDLSRASR